MCVFLHLVSDLSDRFLEQQINVKFCVKLGKNLCDACAVFSWGLWGSYEKVKWIWVVQIVQRELACQNRKWRQCSLLSLIWTVLFTLNSFHKTSQLSLLCRNIEAVWRERPDHWPNSWVLPHDNAPVHKTLSVKQFLSLKSITEMELILFLWFGSKWFLAISKNKVCL
jgi:hypothetical protein